MNAGGTYGVTARGAAARGEAVPAATWGEAVPAAARGEAVPAAAWGGAVLAHLVFPRGSRARRERADAGGTLRFTAALDVRVRRLR